MPNTSGRTVEEPGADSPEEMQALTPHDPEEFDRLSEPPIPVAFTEAFSRGKRAAGLVTGFLLGQGAAQAVSVLAGLFLVRNLSVDAYAQFGIATGFQTVFSVLMDLGFAATIVPLVGSRGEDRAVVGRYVRSARRLRDRTFWLLAPIASVAFLSTIHKHHWHVATQLLLLASILLSLYSGGMVSFFSAPLFLRGKLREFYLPQVGSGAARLLAYVILALLRGLNAWTAALLGALNITINGLLIRRAGRKYLKWPAHEDAAADRELLRYVLPATPAIVFSAFQSQISLFLISIFGTTVYISEVAALSRIGALFAVIASFNTIVIEPYVARLSRPRLPRQFTMIALAAALCCIPPVVIAFRFPMIYLWILGAKFTHLRNEIGWYVLSACMNFFSGMLWIMNRSRKWVFWSGSMLEVLLLLSTQAIFLWIVGLRSTHQAVLFTLVSSVCYLVAHSYVTARGFLQNDPQEREHAASGSPA